MRPIVGIRKIVWAPEKWSYVGLDLRSAKCEFPPAVAAATHANDMEEQPEKGCSQQVLTLFGILLISKKAISMNIRNIKRARAAFFVSSLISIICLIISVHFVYDSFSASPPKPPAVECHGDVCTTKEHITLAEATPMYAALVSTIALVFTAIGTVSTMIIAWRAERRNAEESKLKMEQLKLQLAEANAKLIEQPKPIAQQKFEEPPRIT